jgi:hypothetical protein
MISGYMDLDKNHSHLFEIESDLLYIMVYIMMNTHGGYFVIVECSNLHNVVVGIMHGF